MPRSNMYIILYVYLHVFYNVFALIGKYLSMIHMESHLTCHCLSVVYDMKNELDVDVEAIYLMARRVYISYYSISCIEQIV